MADLKTLNYKRGALKAQLTTYRKQSDRIMAMTTITNREIIDLETRLKAIETLENKFDEIQSEIELKCEDNVREKQYDERGDFDEAFFSLVADIKYFIAEFKRSTETPNNAAIRQGTASYSSSSNTHLKLPAINLPTFDGSPGLWLEFADIYKSIIHDNETISDTDKFCYLRASLSGEALGAIQSIGLAAENYGIAWDTLYDRYNNSGIIIDNHVKALFSLNQVTKDSPSALRSLLDNTSKHLRCLKALNEPTQHWDTLIIHIVSNKLDYFSRREWEIKCKQLTERPKFTDISRFLQDRWEILDKLQRNQTNKTNTSLKHKHLSVTNYATSNTINNKNKCGFCTQSYHPLYFCKEYAKLSVDLRLKEAKRRNLCLNCLRDNHKTPNCKSQISCKICNKRHNYLLHVNDNIVEKQESETQINTNEPCSNTNTVADGSSICNHVSAIAVNTLLSTALARIKDNNGKYHTCRLLLDSASQSSYITRAFCTKLKLTPSKTSMQIIGIAESSTNVGTTLNTTIYSKFCQYKASANLFVLDKITVDLPVNSFDKSLLNLPRNIGLADPNFNQTGPIDVLIGAELFWTILGSNKITLGDNLPTLYKTKFGWILGGEMPNNATLYSKTLSCANTTLENLVQRFWEIESIESDNLLLTGEQEDAELHFQKYTKRDVNGKFIVTLPLKENLNLGNSRYIAERRFHLLEKRFRSNSNLKDGYVAFLKEYETLGHMKLVNECLPTLTSYYMPHHAVIRDSSLTTKIRVVFDASAKTDNGLSLNDTQLIGPTIQSELYAILLRFRTYKYILSGDISKMYRQILLDGSQRSLQRILWRENEHDQLKCYELQTVTYGTGAAPFLATRCLKQLAIENELVYSRESKIIQEDFYMDDLLTGANDINELKIIKENIIKILSSGCFELRKFLSNSACLLMDQTDGKNEDPFLNITASENKTLGIIWNSRSDTLRYKTEKIDLEQSKTKRIILACVAKLFDPLGLVAPIVIVAKLLIQNLWRLKISWDDTVDNHTYNLWKTFANDLLALDNLKIPRLVLNTNANSVQVHGFADASERAYGACVYLRTIDRDSNKPYIQLLTAKSKVAPLKNVSLPRLELSAALLLAELVAKVKQLLNIKLDKIYYWSDSTITLSWIASPSMRWKTFVANRVARIQELTNSSDWNHVKSADNPADLVSRGTTVTNLLNSNLWWQGPYWLLNSDQSWSPPTSKQFEQEISIPELKKVTLIGVIKGNFKLIDKYSNLSKLQRVFAMVLRFIQNVRVPAQNRERGPFTTTELDLALLKLISISQHESFPEEINLLKNKHRLSPKSNILALTPYLDEDDIIRVGGRLRHSYVISEQHKHPMLLNSKHSLTRLIAKHEHIRQLHCGPQALLYSLRNRYWPTSGRNLTRQIVRKCITCFKNHPIASNQIMGDLPQNRIVPAPPFHECGTDFAGPILTKDRKGRGCKLLKSYLCLFVCFATKAYHIEVVSDLSTEGFLAAFKRFISRRGKPLNIHSDNGTNYVGCNTELKALYENLKLNHNSIDSYLKSEGVTWHFIPPRAPHFGGLWESGVKSVKTCLRKIIGNTHLTYEELATVTTQIEAALNSKPLSPLSSDPNDFQPLTPAHFLIGRPLTTIPERILTELPQNRLSRYQLTTQVVQHFWKRWQQEYLNHLQMRSKWKQQGASPAIGDLVLIKEDNMPPLSWKLGRINELHPGSDSVIRVVSVKLPNKTIIKRALSKLCQLPKDDEVF